MSFEAKFRGQFIAFLLILIGAANAAPCCLCEDCAYPPISKGNFQVTDTLTCNLLTLQMANPNIMSAGTQQCTDYIGSYRSKCCVSGTSASTSTSPAPAAAPTPHAGMGPYDMCNLCATGEFPKKPSALTSVSFLPGPNTCTGLYNMGLAGNIPNEMCGPLQIFMRFPCGCV